MRPHSPYEIKALLFPQDTVDEKEDKHLFVSNESESSYRVPKGYALNVSSPMPMDRILGRTIIRESFEHLESEVSTSVGITASSEVISLNLNAGSITSLRSEQAAFYALHDIFMPYWTLYLEKESEFSDEELVAALPKVPDAKVMKAFFAASDTTEDETKARADLERRNKYLYEMKEFFRRYGTHYVKRAWVGGNVTLTFMVSRSSNVTRNEITQAINMSILSIIDGKDEESSKKIRARVSQNTEIVVLGQGGDKSFLVRFSALDLTGFNNWLESVKKSPRVIHADVAGIWTLIKSPDISNQVREAYARTMVLQPDISTVFELHGDLIFIRGTEYTRYDITERKVKENGSFSEWRGVKKFLEADDIKAEDEKRQAILERSPFRSVDAALRYVYKPRFGEGGHEREEEARDKIYFFRNDTYIRYDVENEEVDEGYPKSIQGRQDDSGRELWPGLPFMHVDAVVNWGDGKIYFFSGSRYVRFDTEYDQADPGYPKQIRGNWAGVTFDQVDAVIAFGNGKLYFFRDDQYIRYDTEDHMADPGYPKYISGSNVEEWNFE